MINDTSQHIADLDVLGHLTSTFFTDLLQSLF